jgi:hypothetical protein
MGNIINRLDKAERRISGIEEKLEELLHLDNNKEKNNQS